MTPSSFDSAPLRWRLIVHALDRTGPPMLALAFARWLDRHHPEVAVDLLAFRGGALADDAARRWPVQVVLDDEEPWRGGAADPARAGVLRSSLAQLPPADVTLLVSVAAGQVLELLPDDLGPVVTWAVEVGEDLHWVHDGIGLLERTDRWLAGSQATASALAALGLGPTDVVPEFIDPGPPPSAEARADRRRRLGAAPGDLLVVGAGIGTHRKGIDLFEECALLWRRLGAPSARFVWIGGRRDPLYPQVEADLRRPELQHLGLVPDVADIEWWLAAADVFLHPARADAFPLVCLHASLAGTPVVAFDGVGGVPEMFGPAFVGARYPDLSSLVAVIGDLVDPAARRRVAADQGARASLHTADAAASRLHAELVAVRRRQPGPAIR